MKIIVCSAKEVIVSIPVDTFIKLTGHRIGDYYGNGGTSYEKMVGKEFDLSKTVDAMYQLKVSAEVKNRVKNDLSSLIKSVDTALWPMGIVNEFKAKEEVPSRSRVRVYGLRYRIGRRNRMRRL